MQNTTQKAFSEVYDIINHMEDDIKKQIPNSFITFIKNNRDLNYNVKIDYSQKITNQKLMHETKVLLSLIYRDYICDEEKRRILIKQDNKTLSEKEKILYKKNRTDFEEEEDNGQENKLIIISKEKWYEKIIGLLKKIFKIS